MFFFIIIIFALFGFKQSVHENEMTILKTKPIDTDRPILIRNTKQDVSVKVSHVKPECWKFPRQDLKVGLRSVEAICCFSSVKNVETVQLIDILKK